MADPRDLEDRRRPQRLDIGARHGATHIFVASDGTRRVSLVVEGRCRFSLAHTPAHVAQVHAARAEVWGVVQAMPLADLTPDQKRVLQREYEREFGLMMPKPTAPGP